MKIEDKYFETNTLFVGDREEVKSSVLEAAKKYFLDKELSKNIFSPPNPPVDIFEVEKLNISVDDIRRMISHANKSSENTKLILLSSFYWSNEVQNALLKILEESPTNTFLYLFGTAEKYFLGTVLSRIQVCKIKNSNRYTKLAQEILSLPNNQRLENAKVKKVLSLKVSDLNFDKNQENEKKDRESHILFLQALLEQILKSKNHPQINKDYLEKILEISITMDIEGGSPHLFIDWLLLSAPQLSEDFMV